MSRPVISIIKKVIFYFLVFFFTSMLIWFIYLFSLGRDAAILMYHSVGEPLKDKNPLNMPEDLFERQMKYLYDNHYRVIHLEELADALYAKKPVPPKAVVLTFDDGYENNYTKVFPILKKYGFPATIFVIADYLGREEDSYGSVFKFMSPDMLKEMSDSGLVVFGAHTLDHAYLPKIKDEAELKRQISGSKQALEKILGKQVRFFSYPIGGYDDNVKKIVIEAGYKAAVTTLPEQGYAHDNIYALKRIKLSNSIFNPFVMWVQASGYYLKMKEMNKK